MTNAGKTLKRSGTEFEFFDKPPIAFKNINRLRYFRIDNIDAVSDYLNLLKIFRNKASGCGFEGDNLKFQPIISFHLFSGFPIGYIDMGKAVFR